jgi:hypothetical protein
VQRGWRLRSAPSAGTSGRSSPTGRGGPSVLTGGPAGTAPCTRPASQRLANLAMSPIFRGDRVGEHPADTGHGHKEPHRGVIGPQLSQLHLERVDSCREVVDEGACGRWRLSAPALTPEIRIVAVRQLIRTDRPDRTASSGPGPHSRTKMFLFAHISLRTLGHTVTLTSPRCALCRSSIWVRDWPMPPPIESGVSPLMIPLW